jgi:hypothetical protein
VGVSLCDGTRVERKTMINSRCTRQKIMAEYLCKDAGVDLSKGGGVPALEPFQEYLKDFNITVYDITVYVPKGPKKYLLIFLPISTGLLNMLQLNQIANCFVRLGLGPSPISCIIV